MATQNKEQDIIFDGLKYAEALRKISKEAYEKALLAAIEKAFYTDTNPKDTMPLIKDKK